MAGKITLVLFVQGRALNDTDNRVLRDCLQMSIANRRAQYMTILFSFLQM